jgi:hypothetical protein
MKPWHLRIGKFARVFVRPSGLGQRVCLLLRGYRPRHNIWTKPNGAQAKVEREKPGG